MGFELLRHPEIVLKVVRPPKSVPEKQRPGNDRNGL
jgi:hypothetical protein